MNGVSWCCAVQLPRLESEEIWVQGIHLSLYPADKGVKAWRDSVICLQFISSRSILPHHFKKCTGFNRVFVNYKTGNIPELIPTLISIFCLTFFTSELEEAFEYPNSQYKID